MLVWHLFLILVLVALNGFFVSVEFTAVSARRTRVDLIAGSENHSAKIVKTWLENPHTRDRLIAAAQLGITMVSLALGAVGENTFEALLSPYFQKLILPPSLQSILPLLSVLPLIISLLIVTSFHVVLGEQVPKVATLHQPERIALVAARPMYFFTIIFRWFIDILDWATHIVLQLVGLQMAGEHSLLYTVEELKQIVSESEEGGLIQTPERKMLHAIFDFGELLVRQVMIPRTEIQALEADSPLDEIISLATKSTYTKFPIYEGDLDRIIGVVHVKDLLHSMQSDSREDHTARSLAREALFVPESSSVNILLRLFRDNHQHIAIVMDEYGGTAGLVTLEDLLEEIVGEVSDPFDAGTPEIQPLPDGSVLIDGLTLIEDVNAKLGLDLRDPYYDTMAGYVLGKFGRIPRPKEVVEGDNVRLRVETMDGMRIARISLTRKILPPKE